MRNSVEFVAIDMHVNGNKFIDRGLTQPDYKEIIPLIGEVPK